MKRAKLKPKTYTKNQLLWLVRGRHRQQISFFRRHGPSKKAQARYYNTGIAVVALNVELLKKWLKDAALYYNALIRGDRRVIWEASGFHLGAYGYTDQDADYYWKYSEPN